MGIIMTRRKWITHPFDIDAKQVPSLKMTRWIAAIKKHVHKTPSLFWSFIFMKLERQGTVLHRSLFRLA